MFSLESMGFSIDIKGMIHPENRWLGVWNYVVLVVTILGALIIPVSVVFKPASFTLLIFVNWLIALTFIADIVIQFNTGFMFQGKFVTDRNLVARRYLRSWFTIDLIAAIPIGIILIALRTPHDSLAHLFRLIILIKMLHMGKTMQKLGGVNVNPAILRLFLLVFWFLLAAHIVACLWILISGNPDQLMPFQRYISAFYWTITTLTTIGYGDITPKEPGPMAFVIVIELLGAAMYGLVIGNIANLIANIDIAKTQHREKLDKVNTFLKYRDIPWTMQKKINDYYEYLWETRRGYDETSVLEDLPAPLKESVSLFLNKEIIEKVPIFEGASEDLIKEIVMNMTPVVFTPGDLVVRAGEVGYDMYFISSGQVDVLSADEKTRYATLASGHFFGEIALLLSTPRTATIKAIEYCDLYRLDKITFDSIIQRYPDFAKNIQELAEKRQAEHSPPGRKRKKKD